MRQRGQGDAVAVNLVFKHQPAREHAQGHQRPRQCGGCVAALIAQPAKHAGDLIGSHGSNGQTQSGKGFVHLRQIMRVAGAGIRRQTQFQLTIGQESRNVTVRCWYFAGLGHAYSVRRLPLRTIPALALTVAAALLLSGCVWLRLLDLKDQFAQFDRYITVPPGPGIELQFKHPVLYDVDLDTLITAEPTATATAGTGADLLTVRSYAFSHVPSDSGPDPASAEPILVLTAGIRREKLVFVDLPNDLFRVIPRDLVLRAMRSLGTATVDRSARSATAAVDLQGITAPMPTGTELVALFGQPNQIILKDGKLRVLWRYRLEGKSLRDDSKPVIAAIAFSFAPGPQPYTEQRPSRFQVNISGMWLYLALPAVRLASELHAAPQPLPASAAPDLPGVLP